MEARGAMMARHERQILELGRDLRSVDSAGSTARALATARPSSAATSKPSVRDEFNVGPGCRMMLPR